MTEAAVELTRQRLAYTVDENGDASDSYVLRNGFVPQPQIRIAPKPEAVGR